MDNEILQLAKKRDEQIAKASDDWTSDLRRTTNGGIRRSSLHNIRLYLKNDPYLKGILAFNDFTGQISKLKANPATHQAAGMWKDEDNSILRVYLDEQYDVLFSTENLQDVIASVAREHTSNPMKERIEQAKWDGKPRAEAFFIDYLGAEDNHYTRMVTRKWLSGAVARVYHPGCKFEIIPILEGHQGIGKSTTVSLLAPEYFNDSMKSMGKQKDDYQQLIGSWIIEIAELSAMKKTDIEGLKNFTSALSDYYRDSYGHYATHHPRKNVFIGTTNQRDYLKDATGERRFYPIRCGVNKATKNPWQPAKGDIPQILAEVKTWVDAGEKLYFDQQTMAEAKAYQQEAQTINPMKEAIEEYLSMPVPTNWDELTTSVKHSYFEHYADGSKATEEPPEWLNSQLSNQKQSLPQTTTREILAVVFDKQADSYLSGRINGEAKKVKLIMDNMDGWKYSMNITINGKRQRGYININK
ncbi:virulence protein [Levilactobacillus brevis]|uniref:virulence-associated E family protein n=1 Tax=Levilactobacillus brevis TaxID=1580 RepID=UPI0004299F59|nr:virulence-associated E family protein [Levilactobacillus brevis]ATU69704.1 virulence protein [Levilactobacillus brevis]MDA0409620.1 virulence-associated E family protein [Levilactobacillus brevis]